MGKTERASIGKYGWYYVELFHAFQIRTCSKYGLAHLIPLHTPPHTPLFIVTSYYVLKTMRNTFVLVVGGTCSVLLKTPSKLEVQHGYTTVLSLPTHPLLTDSVSREFSIIGVFGFNNRFLYFYLQLITIEGYVNWILVFKVIDDELISRVAGKSSKTVKTLTFSLHLQYSLLKVK